MSHEQGRNFVAIGRKTAVRVDAEPCANPVISPGKVAYFWEGFQDAFKDQFPDAGSRDLRQVVFMLAQIQVWTWIGEARTEFQPAWTPALDCAPDPCFPEVLPNRRRWDDAILVTELNASDLDHRTRDLDDPDARQTTTLFRHVAEVAREAHTNLDEKVGLLPQSSSDLVRPKDPDPKDGCQAAFLDSAWLEELAEPILAKLARQYPEWETEHHGLIPPGLRYAYVRTIQEGAVVQGEASPTGVGNLLSIWLEAVQLTVSTGGWLTSLYLQGFMNAVLVAQTTDGTRILVTVWDREAPFEAMEAFHDATLAAVEHLPTGQEGEI